ncbi:hypothetical protein B0O80DRAFT_454263 [Mortierella sp. GBAus27b]|nr:hypothetical protein B0O80DRAFT_454263 [Mortierella sp. GBAus27b]
MAGPKLEIFKFGVYIFTPVMFMVYFGAPEFYDKHVRQSRYYPAPENVNTRTGIDRKELLYEVERLKRERLARKATREGDKDV